MGWIRQTKMPCPCGARPTLPSYFGNKHMVGDCWQCDTCEFKWYVELTTKTAYDFKQEKFQETKLEWVTYDPLEKLTKRSKSY
ncbi:hypothetical protein FDI69_gp159 [Rhodococcus phage Trina]|uniref:Uncharacterized protein n=1 Tax=Rhodococcus phage Trina TaxID=2027905 RepID=A0A2D1AEB4_9CAUD|nr:hypothetical protein FDI69_gp159 [Rhodococcus phage Trina]ASZ75027.1 hypothetical protein SEA_TRINA_248 [Rhodococcus phage Trina]